MNTNGENFPSDHDAEFLRNHFHEPANNFQFHVVERLVECRVRNKTVLGVKFNQRFAPEMRSINIKITYVLSVCV